MGKQTQVQNKKWNHYHSLIDNGTNEHGLFTISGLEIQLVIGQRMEAYTWSAYNMVKYLLGLLVESHFSHEFLYISHVHVATLSRYDLSLTLLIYTQFILSWFI